ncbi:MAG: hypothetical protein ACREJ3_03735, partial [Polyangiaceae bacterium]
MATSKLPGGLRPARRFRSLPRACAVAGGRCVADRAIALAAARFGGTCGKSTYSLRALRAHNSRVSE